MRRQKRRAWHTYWLDHGRLFLLPISPVDSSVRRSYPAWARRISRQNGLNEQRKNLMSRRFFLFGCVLVACLAGCGDTRLDQSIRDGNIAAVEKSLSSGADVNAKGKDGQTPLHAAIGAGNKTVYSRLLFLKANPNVCDINGTSVMHLAAQQEDVFWLREALAHGGNPNQPSTGNSRDPANTPIFYAISARRTATAMELISAGADVNHPNKRGTRPLFAAMGCNLFEVMYKLMDAGADLKLTQVIEEGWWASRANDVLRKEDSIKGEENKQWYRKVKTRLIEEGYIKIGDNEQ